MAAILSRGRLVNQASVEINNNIPSTHFNKLAEYDDTTISRSQPR